MTAIETKNPVGRPRVPIDARQDIRRISMTEDMWNWCLAQRKVVNESASAYLRRLVEADREQRIK